MLTAIRSRQRRIQRLRMPFFIDGVTTVGGMPATGRQAGPSLLSSASIFWLTGASGTAPVLGNGRKAVAAFAFQLAPRRTKSR